MNVQFLEKNGQAEYAVVPVEIFKKMEEDVEMLADIQSYDVVKQAMLRGEAEFFSSEFVDKLCEEGANAMREYRKHRGFSQQALADKIGVQQAAIACFESGKREPSAKQLQRMAEALGVDMEDLL